MAAGGSCDDAGSDTAATTTTTSSGGTAGLGGRGGHGGIGGGGGHAGFGVGGVAGGGSGAAGGAGQGGTGGTSQGGGTSVVIETVTSEHRYVPDQMFGGWGPHLGHLVRAAASSGPGTSLWLVDDLCSQAAGPSSCDVLHDHTLGYFERVSSGWQARGTVALPGQIQQNTGTVVSADAGTLHSYGIDVAAHTVVECSYVPGVGTSGCSALPFSLVPNANYLGAAVSPQGYRLVWWTGVQDGGGGTFHYIVDYGGGWNGPRSGDAAGYNDASYINVAFGTGQYANEVTMHAQLVAGWAPDWTFRAAVGHADLGAADPVSWSMPLAPVNGDAVASTNDVWTDPGSNDTHLIARTEAGSAAYYHRPAGGVWSGCLFALPATYRARFVASEGHLVLVYGPNAGGLAYRVAGPADRPTGLPIAWAGLAEALVDLPSDFGSVYAIYPESPAYQNSAAQGIHVALVGSGEQNRLLHVGIEPTW